MKETSAVNNRSVLLDSALQLFAQRGYDAVGVREIVEQVRLTKPTLYYYFSSKQGILTALLEERFDPFLVQLTEATQYQGDLPQSLRQVILLYFDYAQRQPLFFQWLTSVEVAPLQSEAYQTALPFLERQRTSLENLFLAAISNHGNLKGRHSWQALGLLSYIHAVVRRSVETSTELSEQTVGQLVQQFSYGIYS
ncbi:hypothetical protein GCM10028819_26640 [Spirosoma humi]